MSTGNKQPQETPIDHLEEAIDSGQDISDLYFSPGGVSAGRTPGRRREPAKQARKVAAYQRNIDYGESLFHDLVSISTEGSFTSQLTVSANPLAVVGWRYKAESL